MQLSVLECLQGGFILVYPSVVTNHLNWLGRLAVGLGMYVRGLLLQKKRAVW